MNIYKVLPSLTKKRQMNIWHKALRSQWSAEDIKWEKAQRITSDSLKDQLARVLTPVLMGEQSALYSVSGLIPVLGHEGEVESQFYLTTWAVDEARHTELFARFYNRIGREPLPIRRFPAGYIFQSKIVSKDTAEWLAGVLISECLAKILLEDFRRLDLDPVLSDICDGILTDEARHLGFNHIYLEERFAGLFKSDTPKGRAFSDQLRARMAHVLSFIPPILTALASDSKAVGLDTDALYAKLAEDSTRRLEKSIAAGERVAQGKDIASELSKAESVGA